MKIKVSTWCKVDFYVGLFHGLLIQQTENWRSKLSPEMKFIVLAIFSSQIFMIKALFSSLPDNSWSLMLENMFEPVVAICLTTCIARRLPNM